MCDQTIRVGLIGANWGATHIAAWQAVPGVEITGLCTSRRETAEAAAARHGIARPFWDWREMIADDGIDVIDVTVRPTIRQPIAIGALEAKRHLLQPMPFALDLASGRHLCDLAAASGRVAMVESLHRYDPAFTRMKALVDGGAIGRIHTVRGHVRTGILFNPPPDYVYGWIVEGASGASALRNFGAHLLHTLTWLVGPVAAVSARLATNHPELKFTDGTRKPNETADSAMLLARLAGGADAALDISWCTPDAEGFGIDLIGDNGRVLVVADRLGPHGARLFHAPDVSAPLAPVAVDRGSTGDETLLPALIGLCTRMAAAARGAMPADPDFAEAFAIMQVVEAAYRAHDECRWVSAGDCP